MFALLVVGLLVAGLTAVVGLAAESPTAHPRWLHAIEPIAVELTTVSIFACLVLLLVLLL